LRSLTAVSKIPILINLDDLLNPQVKLVTAEEGTDNGSVPSSVPILPPNASVEQLQEAIKSKKPTCAGISASYSCGNHDNVPQYNGAIVPVSAGDDIAMNSMVLSVVSIDGSGNGEGLIKVPMLNNIKIGVALSGIKVAEGGCIVAGKAETSGIDVAVLNDKQRQVLKKAYAVYQQVLNVAAENAGAIAETYNSIADLYNGIAQKTQAILDKVNEGKKISKAEQKALAEMKKKAKEGIDKQIAYFTKKFGSEGSGEIIKLVNLASQSCTCEAYTETSEPKKGPNANAGEWILYDDDCKKCLEEDKKRQQEMAKLAKAFEEKLKAIKGKKMECGCFKWGTILKDLGTDDKDCDEIAAKMNQMREDFKSSLYAIIEVLEKLEGQVMIGENCIDKFSIEISNNTGMDVTSIPRDEYNEPNREINNNQIELYNDRTKYPQRYLTLKTDNNDQAKLVEKWLFDGVKQETTKQEKVDFTGALSLELLKQIFPQVENEVAKGLLPFINKYLTEFGITTCEERIHFFAQIAEETTQMKDLTELPSKYKSRKSRYKGRGLIQLTGSGDDPGNYETFQEYCRTLGDNVDFVNNPNEVSSNPKYAVLSAFWYWKIEKKCTQYSSNLSEENLLKISKLVNCGNSKFCGYKKNPLTGKKEKCFDCEPNGWEKRKREFKRLKNKFSCVK
jgi:predicted chitinase